jgi:FixJ family two-component response regulator
VAKVTELGAAEFLEKPANPEVIYQAIARLAGVEARED